MKPLPNFLLVGAAKSGTTSLYMYLNSHPEVFMSSVKEPLFFVSEIIEEQKFDPWMKKVIKNYPNGKAHIDTWEDYLKLFEDSSEYKAIGEASASYLYYYNHAIPKIKKYLGEVKIIILLRNPIYKVLSQYKYLKSHKCENLSLIGGIKKEDERIKKKYCSLYHYKNQSLYYEQVKAYMENFKNVKIILSEDLENKTTEVLNDIFSFLGVSIIKNDNWERFNETKVIPRFYFLQRIFLSKIGTKIRKKYLEKRMPKLYYSLKLFYRKINLMNISLDKDTMNYLYKLFESDIEKLEKLINRDLSAWKVIN